MHFVGRGDRGMSWPLTNGFTRNGLSGNVARFGPVLYLGLAQVLGSLWLLVMQGPTRGPLNGASSSYDISDIKLICVKLS